MPDQSACRSRAPLLVNNKRRRNWTLWDLSRGLKGAAVTATPVIISARQIVFSCAVFSVPPLSGALSLPAGSNVFMYRLNPVVLQPRMRASFPRDAFEARDAFWKKST